MAKDKYLIIYKGIARWKLNNPIENWLSYRADKSELWKYIYVLYYQLFDRKYYQAGLKLIENQLKVYEKEWKGISRNYVIRDMVYSLHRFGADFQDYWNYNFLNLSAIGRERYVVDKLRYGYDVILSTPEIERLVSDKYLCYQKFQQYYKRDILGCYNINDIKSFISFMQKHHAAIYKPLNLDCGRGVKKKSLSVHEVEDFFHQHIKVGPFVIEEAIEQSAEMAQLHPQSVNTVRIMTFMLKGEIKIIASSLRMGVGDSIADNAGSGGIFSSIDPESGIVISKARNYRGDKYIKHPDTNVIIPGFKIPLWNDLLEVVKSAAFELQSATLLSWDFALSRHGWVIVEVNTGGDWIILQAAQNEPLKKKLYEFIDELNR